MSTREAAPSDRLRVAVWGWRFACNMKLDKFQGRWFKNQKDLNWIRRKPGGIQGGTELPPTSLNSSCTSHMLSAKNLQK